MSRIIPSSRSSALTRRAAHARGGAGSAALVASRRAPARRAATTVLDGAALEAVAAMFKTLSDPTRLRILTALAAGAACVHELTAQLAMSQTAMSHQLRLLRVARLVQARRAGREIFYSLADDHVLSLVEAARSHAAERR